MAITEEEEKEYKKNKEKKKNKNNNNNKKERFLSVAPPGTAQRLGKLGGLAPHKLRGLQAASEATRRKVSTLGGKNRHHNHHQVYGANFYSVISKEKGKGSEILEEHYSVEVYDSGDDDGNGDNGSSRSSSKNNKT